MQIPLKLSLFIILRSKTNINKPMFEEDILIALLSGISTTLICDSLAICIDAEVEE